MTTFSVVTPSFQQVEWLQLAIRSVADQQTSELQIEHVIQDACSSDGTAEMLACQPHLTAFIEKDNGMYDAINRGLRRTTGEIVSYLNCDEQYLPGTLAKVSDFFAKNLDIDMLFAGLIVVDDHGRYLCSRKVLPPLPAHTRVCHLSTFTCSTFFRRRLLDEHGLYFDPAWKAVGDAEWILRCLRKGVKMAAIPDFASVFVDTGSNLGGTAASNGERNRLRDQAPLWERASVPLIAVHHRLRRWLGGIYQQQPFEYSIYTKDSPEKRTAFSVPHPTTMWRQRFTWLR
ncbi:MAG: glycosyltransferase family 2 protein [Chthoniobacterales bacterium]